MTKEREQLMNELADKRRGSYCFHLFIEGFKAADAHPTDREMKLVEALKYYEDQAYDLIAYRKQNLIPDDIYEYCLGNKAIQALADWNASQTKDGE